MRDETTTTYRAPLSPDDAAALGHLFELRAVMASIRTSTVDDAYNCGEVRRWVVDLLRGESVEIPNTTLADSRRIMGQFRSASAPAVPRTTP